MATTQFMDSPLQVWANYDTAPARVTSIDVANPFPVAQTVQVQRNNGQWTTFTVPASMVRTTFSVNSAQYTITVALNPDTGQVEVDQFPSIQTG